MNIIEIHDDEENVDLNRSIDLFNEQFENKEFLNYFKVLLKSITIKLRNTKLVYINHIIDFILPILDA